ncbi:MAG: 5'/3'-nucleotidase SurE [Deltaproteobacteria bacterium]|nr:5'/3'-nucleotidase SurE [Deltaproteobacteria bacterium]
MSRPLVLLSNDDGWDAPGIRALGDELGRFAEVVTCAPERDQCAASHSLTLDSVLRLRQVRPGVFALDGTPADCVYVAVHSGTRLLPRRPDLVVSGMNRGPNLGVDVLYSGTVAAAREGANRGLPALAVSADPGADVAPAAVFGAKLAAAVLARIAAGPPDTPFLLNLNIPAGSDWPLRVTKLGRRDYDHGVVYRTDPRGREYLWLAGTTHRHGREPGTDTAAYEEGCASLTPLALDVSAPELASLAHEIAARGASLVR